MHELPWAALAAAFYAANLLIGSLSLRGRRVPRVWHGRVFICAVLATALAAALSFPEHPWRGSALALALVPLALLPWFGRPVRRDPRLHIGLSVSAAPFYAVALALMVGA